MHEKAFKHLITPSKERDFIKAARDTDKEKYTYDVVEKDTACKSRPDDTQPNKDREALHQGHSQAGTKGDIRFTA